MTVLQIFSLSFIFHIGHGFKLAPVVGKILGCLALDKVDHGYNLDELSIERFSKMKQKPSSTGVTHHML